MITAMAAKRPKLQIGMIMEFEMHKNAAAIDKADVKETA
jgi:hypothetical protein